MFEIYAIAFLIALVSSYFITPQVKRLALRAGALDAPDERKVHTQPIPRLGGLAIYAGFMLAVVASVHISRELLGILLGGTVVLLVGVVDDLKPLPAKLKLFGQIIAASVPLLFGVRIEWLTNPFGGMIYLDYLSIPLTILWIVSLVNTINLIDGLDGLAAGVATIASITILLVAVGQNFWIVAILTAALAGSALGFLQHNFNPAKIFMGDTGSMFLGYMLAAVSALGTVKSAATIALVVPAVALGLPIMDTACAIIRRFNSGKPIFKPDKGHLHHRLLAMGWTQRQVVLLMYVITAGLGISAILLTEASLYSAALILLVLVAVAGLVAQKTGVLKEPNSVKVNH